MGKNRFLGTMVPMENPQPVTEDHTQSLPEFLSPSRLADYRQCPKLFYYKTICGVATPPTEATIKGNLAHYAYEHTFSTPQGSRTVEASQDLIDTGWAEMTGEYEEGTREHRDSVAARELFPEGSEDEARLLTDSKALVASWYEMERVNNFTPVDISTPNGEVIDGREVYVNSTVGSVPMHGYVDRLDSWESGDTTHWAVSDYKTGKVPAPRFKDKYFDQLRIYAVLLKKQYGVTTNVLRLVFTKSGNREQGILTEQVTPARMAATEAQVDATYKKIKQNAKSGEWPTQTGPLCNWCYFQDICPAFNSNTDGIALQDS